MTITREDLLNAKGYDYDNLVNYADLLAAHVGVRIGEEIASDVIGEAPASFTNVIYDELGRAIEVEEFELYVAARLEDEDDSEIYYFALEEIAE